MARIVAQQLEHVAVGILERAAANPEHETAWSVFVCTFTRVPFSLGDMRGRSASALQVAEQLLELSVQTVADPAADADATMRSRPVPVLDVVGERLPRRGADGLLAADDVPAERLVAVEERLVDAADETRGVS